MISAIKKELENIIKGINLIPTMREGLINNLESKGLDGSKIKEILEEKVSIKDLSKSELNKVLTVIYEITGNEDFNIQLSSDEKEDNGRTYMIEDETLYYNFNRKDEFSRTYASEETRRVVMSLFRRSSEMEHSLKKDLSEFNVSELESFLKSLKTTTIRSLQNHISKIERYTAYSMDNGYTDNKINYAKMFDREERVENLLDKDAQENMVLSRREVMSMAMNADNAQDGVILALLFEGVSLRDDFEELINLKIKDCDLEGGYIKTSNGRTIEISRDTATIIKEASRQDEKYVSITGDSLRRYKVAQGENVLRGLRGRAVIKSGVVGRRIARMAEQYGYDYMNATNISYSGQLHLSSKLLDEGKDMDYVLNEVLGRFAIPINDSSLFYLRSRIERYLERKK